MRILHITSMLEEGGLETFLYVLLSGLRRGGYEVEVLVMDKNKMALKELFEEAGIKVHRGVFGWVYNPLNIFVVWYYAFRFDVVHVHLFPTQYFAALARLIGRPKINFVTTEHSTYNKRRNYRWLRGLERFVYGRYDRITAVSLEAEKALDKWAGTDSRSVMIYNGIKLDAFTNVGGYNKPMFGLTDRDKIVMMVARFFDQKDHMTPIRAMQHVPEDVHLFFVGSGNSLERHRFAAQELGLKDRVHFLGNRRDIPRLVGMCDVGILASNLEGFGLSVLEIMAAGKPVVVSDIDGLRDLVEGAGILFRNYDEHDLADKLMVLLENEEYYHQIAVACQERSGKFSDVAMIKEYMKLYESLRK